MINDPIGDLLIRIKNGGLLHKAEVRAPYSTVKEAVVKTLLEAGYIENYEVRTGDRSSKKELVVQLKYDSAGKHYIRGVKRVSSPSRHFYLSTAEMRRYIRGKNHLGVISTSKGVMPHYRAAKERLGGELMAVLW